jgi:outer membrane murein-binding lipoprotein Lpp
MGSTGWAAFPWQALAVVVAAAITGTVALVGIVVSQGAKTRERIDALSASLGSRVDHLQADLEGTRRDVALLGQRVGTLPSRVVDEEDCRDRHEQLREEIVSLSSGRRLVVTGFGGDR